MTLRERVAIAICQATSGGEGPEGVHQCECAAEGKTDCADMLRAADAALAVAGLDRMESALEQIANFGPEITHHWADHVRQVAKQALKND